MLNAKKANFLYKGDLALLDKTNMPRKKLVSATTKPL